jgi:DNA-binding GntR family transcriptional regulator
MSGSESRSDAVADAVRAAIVTGRLKPGERIIEDVVAEEHDVSRVPVREALRRLEAEGFITLTPYRGATVVAPSRREGLELLAVRRGLEVLAARLASERRGQGYESELLETVVEETAASHAHDVGALLRLSLHFHEVVRLASGNEQLGLMLSKLVERISWVFELDVDERSAGAVADHSAIAHAILNGASIQASYLMDEHVAQDEALYRGRTPLGT